MVKIIIIITLMKKINKVLTINHVYQHQHQLFMNQLSKPRTQTNKSNKSNKNNNNPQQNEGGCCVIL